MHEHPMDKVARRFNKYLTSEEFEIIRETHPFRGVYLENAISALNRMPEPQRNDCAERMAKMVYFSTEQELRDFAEEMIAESRRIEKGKVTFMPRLEITEALQRNQI